MNTIPQDKIVFSDEMESLIADFLAGGGEISVFPQGVCKDWAPAIAGADKARKSGSASKTRTKTKAMPKLQATA